MRISDWSSDVCSSDLELVLAIGAPGSDIPPDQATRHVFGLAVGIDLTRRDRQLEARNNGRPWDIGKACDSSAPLGRLQPPVEGDLSRRREIRTEIGRWLCRARAGTEE